MCGGLRLSHANLSAHRGVVYRCVSQHSLRAGNEDCNFLFRAAKKALRGLRGLAENAIAPAEKEPNKSK